MNLTIHVDGGARGNPGPAGIACVLYDQDAKRMVHEAGYYIGRATNNVAEYRALIRALELAEQYKAKTVHIRCDSELVVKQITGQYKVKSADLQELHQQVQMLMLRFDSWQIKHVYREQNKRADQLVNMALDAKADVIVTPAAGSQNASNDQAQGSTRSSGRHGSSASLFDAPVDKDDTPAGQYPKWNVTVTSEPETPWEGGCKRGQKFTFGPATPAGMCVYAAQAMFELSPTTDLDGKGPRATFRCPQCDCMLSVEMKS